MSDPISNPLNTPMLDEWDALGTEWRTSGDAVLPTATLVEQLHRRVQRRDWQRAATLALEVVVSASVVWWSLGVHPRDAGDAWALRLGIVVFTAVVWGFGLWNRRHGWRAEGETSADFVRLSRERLAEGRRSIRFMRITLGLAGAGMAPWFVARAARSAIVGSEWGVWVIFLAYLVGMLAWCAAYARWIAREDAWLDDLARELASQGEGEGIAGASRRG